MTCDYLQLQDFFVAGLGCEIGGAILLARGLVSSAPDLTRLAGSFFGSNRYEAVSLARDKIDAITGLSALGIGFVLQTVGYLADLAEPHAKRTGTSQALAGTGFVALTFAIVFLVGWVHRRKRLIPTLVEMSRYTLDGSRMEHPRASLLPGWALALGYRHLEGENDLDFLRRTLGIEDLTVDMEGGQTRRASDPPGYEVITD